MHVGLNLVYLVPEEVGGMEVYARELIPALARARSGVRLTVFLPREAEGHAGPWDEAQVVIVPVRARRRAEWVRGEQQHLPGLARRASVDVVHSLANTSPARGRFARVVTIHDLIHRRYPAAHTRLHGLGMRMLVSLAGRTADRVIVSSRAGRRELVELLHLDPATIDVVPLGQGTRPDSAPEPEDELRRRWDLGRRPVVLSVSAKRPHKNLPALLDAMAAIPADRRPLLVLPGYRTEHELELRARARSLGIEPDLRILGWVSASELEGLYALAGCFVFPSLWEGFGLPVVEAMQRGVPVACSDRGALPEVAGSAARIFDPTDPRAITAAIEAIVSDPGEAARLSEAGRRQAARYSWEETARGTLAAYDRALGRPGERPAGAERPAVAAGRR